MSTFSFSNFTLILNYFYVPEYCRVIVFAFFFWFITSQNNSVKYFILYISYNSNCILFNMNYAYIIHNTKLWLICVIFFMMTFQKRVCFSRRLIYLVCQIISGDFSINVAQHHSCTHEALLSGEGNSVHSHMLSDPRTSK